jgi:hypothetical protein
MSFPAGRTVKLLFVALACLIGLTAARPLVREIRSDREFQRLLKVSSIVTTHSRVLFVLFLLVSFSLRCCLVKVFRS